MRQEEAASRAWEAEEGARCEAERNDGGGRGACKGISRGSTADVAEVFSGGDSWPGEQPINNLFNPFNNLLTPQMTH